jgi:peroxiredoxin
MGLSLAGTEPSGEFHGRRPTSERPLPDFIALNHLGQGRSAADLVGSPTVLWFYPMAGTPG